VLLSRTKFFDGGHPLSGFSAKQLGREATYAGRGRIRTPEPATAGLAPPAEDPPRRSKSASRSKAGAPPEPAKPAGQSIAARRAAAQREADDAVRTGKDA